MPEKEGKRLPTMIERIASAEAEAAKIKKDAVAKGREEIADSLAKAAAQIDAAKAEARVLVETERAKAEEEGAQLTEGILAARKAEADALCDKARAKLPQAAELIVGRVVGT